MDMMDLDELPNFPFQDLPEYSSLFNFSATNHHAPPLLYHAPPPQFRRGNWKPETVEAMREMTFRAAALQPVTIDPESVKPPKRRNVKISKDPQSVAARHRRERISERIRILQRLVPGGTKMDTASMLDEAVHYMTFLKKQVQTLEQAAAAAGGGSGGGLPETTTVGVNVGGCSPTAAVKHYGASSYWNIGRACGQPATGAQMVASMELRRAV